MPPFGSAEFRLEPGGQSLQGIFVGRRGEDYRRRFLRLTVLLLERLMVTVVMVMVMTSLTADLLTAGLLL